VLKTAWQCFSFSSYVRFDIIRRILTRVFGCNVVMAMSITDVDDKIIKRANEVSSLPHIDRQAGG
jgi:cysteinyl-tRNA synthetase